MKVFQKLGAAGLLGVNKPVEYGGMGLSFKYNVALNEEIGNINCGGIPMSIAVQTDMATPALARLVHFLWVQLIMYNVADRELAGSGSFFLDPDPTLCLCC